MEITFISVISYILHWNHFNTGYHVYLVVIWTKTSRWQNNSVNQYFLHPFITQASLLHMESMSLSLINPFIWDESTISMLPLLSSNSSEEYIPVFQVILVLLIATDQRRTLWISLAVDLSLMNRIVRDKCILPHKKLHQILQWTMDRINVFCYNSDNSANENGTRWNKTPKNHLTLLWNSTKLWNYGISGAYPNPN